MTTSALERSNLNVSDFHHTPFYCEENVYLLCKKLCADGIADAEGSDLFVVFISNEKKQIALWNQKASKRADGVILWDYHVICIQKKSGGDPPLVWDLDSNLPFPSPLASYVLETIRPSFQLFPDYQRPSHVVDAIIYHFQYSLISTGVHEMASLVIRLFRIVHAPVFLRCFASDRRHMKDSDGNWIAEPPLHEPIVAEDGTVHNLNEYFNISAADAMTGASINSVKEAIFTRKYGVVIKENQLEELFSHNSLKQPRCDC